MRAPVEPPHDQHVVSGSQELQRQRRGRHAAGRGRGPGAALHVRQRRLIGGPRGVAAAAVGEAALLVQVPLHEAGGRGDRREDGAVALRC